MGRGSTRGRRRGAALIGSLVLAFGAGGLGAEELVDGIAAQVGSDVVLVSEVYQVSAPAEEALRAEGGDPQQLALLRAEILERLIERALIRQVVRRAELSATDAEVDEAIEAIAAENGISAEEVRRSVEAKGLPYDAYRERIRGEIEQSKVINGMVASRVRVDERDVRRLYEREFADQPEGGEQCSLRLMLMTFPEDATSAQRASVCGKVGAARARALGGEDFVAVAAEYQRNHGAIANDISAVHTSEIAPWMEKALADLETGELSPVLETPQGCALIELIERRPYTQITYDDAREALRRELFDQKMEEEYVEFLDTVRGQTFIERKGIFADQSSPGALPGEESGAPTF